MIPVISGRLSSLILLMLTFGCVYGLTYASKKGLLKFKMRKFAALDAMPEAVGRAVEMGRPVHFTPGRRGLTHTESAMTISGTAVLAHLAKLVARYKSRIIVSVGDGSVVPLMIETVKQAYQAEGQPEMFRLEDIRYHSDLQMAYAAGIVDTLIAERCGANIFLGGFAGEVPLIAEGGVRAGAINIGGTARLVQIPILAVMCDYCLYGEELYAAGAYLSDDLEQKGSLAGEDWAKIAGIVIMILGAAALTLLNDKTIQRWLTT